MFHTRRQSFAIIFATLVCCQVFLPALAFPNPQDGARKFPAKSNNLKKTNAVERIEKEDTAASSLSETSNGGFSWQNIIGTLLQMFLGGGGGLDKSDSQNGGFNWMSLVSLGARLLMNTLSGDNSIDKADGGNGMPPALQAIQLVTSLLEALKMSFSQRSSEKRSTGEKDALADVGIATVTLLKGYVNTMKVSDDVCAQKAICEANAECARDTEGSGYLACQIGTYAVGYALEKTNNTPLDLTAEAGREGRTGTNCGELYYQCNAL